MSFNVTVAYAPFIVEGEQDQAANLFEGRPTLAWIASGRSRTGREPDPA